MSVRGEQANVVFIQFLGAALSYELLWYRFHAWIQTYFWYRHTSGGDDIYTGV